MAEGGGGRGSQKVGEVGKVEVGSGGGGGGEVWAIPGGKFK